MGIYETFSKRMRKRERAGQVDVYQYEVLPERLRVQVIHIWREYRQLHSISDFWDVVHDVLANELGVFHLGPSQSYAYNKCQKFLLHHKEVPEVLDLVELSLHYMNICIEDYQENAKRSYESLVDELNYRFRENGVGYQFVDGQIVRVDSQYVHAEVVKPAIQLLNTAGFEGASDEFLKAHEEYRSGDYPGAITNASKAFESTMKSICDKQGWSYPSGATAKQLIKVVLDNRLIPQYLETHLAGLRSTLEAGLPTVRNKDGGHGQGSTRKEVSQHLAGYALHLAATNIVFMVEAHETLKHK